MSGYKKATFFVRGMHCPSCEILIKDKFLEENNIKEVKPDFKTCKVELAYVGTLDKTAINKKIIRFGYKIVDKQALFENVESLFKRIFDFFAISAMMMIIYFIGKEINIIPEINLSGNFNYLNAFILGLIASTSTCMATSGALFLATVGKLRNNENSIKSNLLPAISFNLGRVISYGLFGLLAGIVGGLLLQKFNSGPILTLLIGVFMVFLGLDMSRIISIGSIIPAGATSGIFEKLEHQFLKNPKKTAFLLGAITYLLPCGFTQTVQVYVLGLGNPGQSALTMIVFALGTVPALLLVGSLTSLTQSKFYPFFMKAMGVLVFLIGINYFMNFLSLKGISFSPGITKELKSVKIENGIQIVNMEVNGYGYEPNEFTIKKNIAVKWTIDGKNVFGCQGFLVVPKLGIQKTLQPGNNIIEFTPTETGPLFFSCSMGMYRGKFEVI